MSLKYIIVVLFTFYVNNVFAHGELCPESTHTRFLNREDIFSHSRSEDQIVIDILYTIECEHVAAGEKLAELLLKKRNNKLGFYFLYRFSAIKAKYEPLKDVRFLINSAESGYTRAMYELAIYYQGKIEILKAFQWFKQSALLRNRKAIISILSDNEYIRRLNQQEYEEIVLLFLFCIEQKEQEKYPVITKKLEDLVKEIDVVRYNDIVKKIIANSKHQFGNGELSSDIPWAPVDW